MKAQLPNPIIGTIIVEVGRTSPIHYYYGIVCAGDRFSELYVDWMTSNTVNWHPWREPVTLKLIETRLDTSFFRMIK
jgi:hypothetical protein